MFGRLQRWTTPRRTRSFFVAALAAIAIGLSVPNLYYLVYPMYGTFGGPDGFATDENNVVVVDHAQKAGVALGDRVASEAMKPDDRYGGPTGRFPPIGTRVTFPMQHGNVRYNVTATAKYYRELWSWSLPSQIVKKTASLILILVGSALFLVRPVPVSGAFFIYAVGSTRTGPYFFSFLPMTPYFVLMSISDALTAAGAAAFLWLALHLGNERGRTWIKWVPLYAFLGVYALILVPDARSMLLGQTSGALGAQGESGILTCVAVGTLALIATASKPSVRRAARTTAAWLAVAGASMVVYYGLGHIPFDFQNLTPAMRFAVKNTWEAALIANIAASLIAAYFIVRGRVVDTGVLVSRVFVYIGASLAIVVAVGAVNWAYAQQLSKYPLAIPLEVMVAIALGYRLSGFRDIARALSLAAVDAPNACAQGRTADERTALTKALGFSEHIRQKRIVAEVRAQCAFSAWFAGDDELFDRHIAALRELLETAPARGLDFFLEIASSGEVEDSGAEPDVQEWRARGELIACGCAADTIRAQQHACKALSAADESGADFLRILALVAIAELFPDERGACLDAADALAERNALVALCKSIRAIRSDARDIGMLQSFVDARLLKVRPARPFLEVLFFTGEVRVLGTRIDLPEKELELLFTVASIQSPFNGEELMDLLWPEADGDAARNAFRVCLHRLRRHAGDPLIVRRIGSGYALHPAAAVDLWKLQNALNTFELRADPESRDALEILYSSLQEGAQRRTVLGLWFAPFERMLAHRSDDVEKILAKPTIPTRGGELRRRYLRS